MTYEDANRNWLPLEFASLRTASVGIIADRENFLLMEATKQS